MKIKRFGKRALAIVKIPRFPFRLLRSLLRKAVGVVALVEAGLGFPAIALDPMQWIAPFLPNHLYTIFGDRAALVDGAGRGNPSGSASMESGKEPGARHQGVAHGDSPQSYHDVQTARTGTEQNTCYRGEAPIRIRKMESYL